MHHQLWFQETMEYGPYCLWLTSFLIYCTQQSGLREKQSGSQIKYAKPMQERISLLVFAVSLPWVAATSYLNAWYLFVSVILMLSVVNLSGPSEVTINLEKRTYLARDGWPFAPKVWSGPIEEISEIQFISPRGASGFLIAWWKARRTAITLGQFGDRAEAEAAATQVANLLGMEVSGEATERTIRFSRG